MEIVRVGFQVREREGEREGEGEREEGTEAMRIFVA